jgi:uncharacterized protein
MKFTREYTNSLMIRSVSADGIVIGEAHYRSTIALTADAVFDEWSTKPVADLAEEDFADLLEAGPELIVLGTGSSNVFPPRQLVFSLARRGIGLEVMDTAAAARTFNVLAGDGRHVVAVLYI